MSASTQKENKQQQQQHHHHHEEPLIDVCGGCGKKPKKDVTFLICAACKFVAYCSAACQKKAWPDHKEFCNHKKKEHKEREKAKEVTEAAKTPSSSSGNGKRFKDMGSLLNALMPPQPQTQPQRYWEGNVWNACFDGHEEELQKILRQRGLDVNWAEPETGSTAALIAAELGHDKCLTLLSQQRGIDLSKENKYGTAPIHMACQNGRYACTEILLANNHGDANLSGSDGDGTTPAMLCSQNGHVKCLALLSDKGADLNLSNRKGQTAAHVACEVGQFKCLQLLISRGAEINSKDLNGLTPLDHARMCKQRECIHLLVVNGGVGRSIKHLPPVPEADKEHNVNFSKEAKDKQREVRQCEHPDCQVRAKDGAVLLKCAGCRVTLYCCKDHAVQHLPEHESFCKELTQVCDFPGCEERGEVKCWQCKVALYCSTRHRTKHLEKHESLCEELRALR